MRVMLRRVHGGRREALIVPGRHIHLPPVQLKAGSKAAMLEAVRVAVAVITLEETEPPAAAPTP